MTAWDDYITDLRKRLRSHPDSWSALSAKTGGIVSSSWLSKFARGEMDNPRADSLRALDTAMSETDDLDRMVSAARGVKPT